MKQMYSVNLGGMLFHINNDAYEELRRYLESIKKHFSKEESKEIMEEIETRLAELLSMKLTQQKQVVSLEDVQEAIEVIGQPEDFTDEEHHKKEEKKHMGYTKRLYRDPDNRILGGVCAGLGEYFNLDPVLIRFLFILFTLFFAVGLLIYLILWLITPEAETLAQKREMKGDSFDFNRHREKKWNE